MTINTLDAQTAGSLTQTFENDIGKTARVVRPEQLQVPENILTTIVDRYFFDQL
ncbi:MAG: hypothetical protein AB2L14_11290 [Candidatus Xenobiia bacterium LiM19]